MEINIPGLPEANVSGFPLPDPGRYQMRIIGVEEDNKNPSKPKLVFTYYITDGPQQINIVQETGSNSPVGMQVKEFVPLQATCAFRVKNIMVAAGVLSRDDTTTARIETEQLLSQVVTAEITHEEYEGKVQLRFKYIF